jgi:hypothetical protein
MRLTRIREFSDALTAAAAQRNLEYRLRTNAGATETALAACEAAIGYALPPSVRELLGDSDGIEIDFAELGAPPGHIGPSWVWLNSTMRIAEFSAYATSFAKDIDESYDVTSAPRRFIEVANADDDRILLHPYRRGSSDAEFPVAVLEEAEGLWVRDETSPLLELDFDAWLERVLEHAVRTGAFSYWEPE